MLFTLNVETDAAAEIARFKLQDEHGRHLAANEVKLGDHGAAKWEGLFDTRRHVDRYAHDLIREGQDKPETADQMIERLGVFLGREVLGPQIMDGLLTTEQRRTLLVQLPAATDVLAAAMARVPWEIARKGPGDEPLMSRGLVVRVVAQGVNPPRPEPAGDPVRVLLVFAEAPGSRPLAMRLEREDLLRLFFDQVLPRRRVEVDVLCHGVTRSRLVEQVRTRGGYEVVHWSGHGHHNLLELRGEDGRQDLLTGRELVELFTTKAGGFIPRLVFLSACLSGTLIHVKDWASFQAALEGRAPADGKRVEARGLSEVLEEQPGYTGTALELLKAGVPQVVAMRYEVGDAYARTLARRFYKHLLGDQADHPADSALALARSELLQENDPSAFDAVDHATPLIFGEPGPVAARLGRSGQIRKRRPQPQPLTPGGGTELDPLPPAQFVGRSKELTRLAESWLPRDAAAVAVVQGLAGMGKTAIASEAINVWHTRFDWVFTSQAKPTPLTLDEFCRNLHTRLALASELYREKCEESPFDRIYLEPSPTLTGEARYAKMRTNLVEALRDEAILLVLDNYETNLEEHPRDGGYASQDPAWDRLLSELAGALPPTGSRLLVTTRHWPQALLGAGVLRLPLGPLPIDEAVLFLRGHDTLRRLHASDDAGKALVLRLMAVSRGHPLILDRLGTLADDPPELSRALGLLEQKGYQALPDLFQADQSDAQRLQVYTYLEDVVVGSVDLLLQRVSPDARRLLWVITQASEPVTEGFLEGVWSGRSVEEEAVQFDLARRDQLDDQSSERLDSFLDSDRGREILKRIEQSQDSTPSPPIGPRLRELHAAGLLTEEQPDELGEDVSLLSTGPHAVAWSSLGRPGYGAMYAYHEVVRERIAAWMEARAAERGDLTPEQLWVAYGERYAAAFEQLTMAGVAGARDRASEAGRRALSYLVRARAFDRLVSFASRFITGTNDPQLLRQVTAELKAIADKVPPGKARWTLRTCLADALRQAGRSDEALELYAQAADDAEAAERWADVGSIYNNWANALCLVGQLDVAKQMNQRGAEAKRKAGRPLVDVFGSELQALRIDEMQGHAEQALPEIERRLEQLRTWWRHHREGQPLPDAPDQDYLGRVLVGWLDLIQSAYGTLERWQPCLNHLEEIETVQRERGESEHAQARTRFNQYGPLLSLGRLDDAQRVLESCLTVFRKVNDHTYQAKTLGALADVWDKRGDTGQAVAVQRQALTVHNGLPDPEDRANSHHNLAIYLKKADQIEEPARQLLAAIVYRVVTGYQTSLMLSLHNLAIRIRQAARSGQAPYELPRLSELLAGPGFDALARFLTQRGVDRDELQAAIEGLVERTRQHALGPEVPAQDEAQATAASAAEPLLEQLARAAASGQDIDPLSTAAQARGIVKFVRQLPPKDRYAGWEVRNARRIEMVKKKNREGLTLTELSEFDQLQTGYFEYLDEKCPRTLPDESHLSRIEARLNAGEKPREGS